MKRILLLDDDIDILNVVKLLLSYHNYKVKTIHEWHMVETSIEVFIPDLIMLDIDLSGADGSEICKKLKLSKETKNIPVILISAHKIPAQYLKQCKAQGFVGKPFEIPDLLEVISSNLN